VIRRKRVGVIGSFVWDVIHGRDVRTAPVEEWGGITYALSAFDAALSDDWELVPVMKVGSDLAAKAREFLGQLRHTAPDAALYEVPVPNNRVELRYTSDERRSEVMSGGVPGWSWAALQPMLTGLDALYVNLISGWEIDLDVARLLRQGFRGPIYCDLHSVTLSLRADGLRELRPLTNVAEWCRCFDIIQVNEDELAMMAPDGLALAATALAAGVRCLCVTLGPRGMAYFAASGFDRLSDLAARHELGVSAGAIRTQRIAAAATREPRGDPTGCGDVWGATYFSRLLAGDMFPVAIDAAQRAAARNFEHRGASGLASYLRGELSTT
jgi:sugar/nucleoside kinase (ribokinase family)